MLNISATTNWAKWALKINSLSIFRKVYRSPQLHAASTKQGAKSATEAEMQAIDPSDLLCFPSFYFSILIQVLPSSTFFFELIQHSEKTNPTLWINQFNIFRINVEIVYYIC